jgi:hypothetical protein
VLTAAERLARFNAAGDRAAVAAKARRREARAWWACGALYTGVLALDAWVIYRTFAGHPILGGLRLW